ncbi:LPS assembly lipoprotein LptE [Nitratidesulfovibrio sp.]|uniref:LPS assembly lipoprotein LptE n=1 Tax=Nitratidesulfovibrio sp. TaxID=2802297 RepID=UPI00334100AB
MAAASFRNLGPCAGRNGGFLSRMTRRALRVLTVVPLLAALAVLSGCAGYNLTSEETGIFGDGSKTLKIKSVDNPTMYPWLPYMLRSALRDEVAARSLAVWKDEGRADYEIKLRVHYFRLRGDVRDSDDRTQLYTASMAADATVYDGTTNAVLWESKLVTYYDSYDTYNEREAAERVGIELVRRLVDRMRQRF